jgi:Tol biopolymer transport system component
MRTSGFRIAVPIVAGALCAPSLAQVTQRVSLATSGAQANGHCYGPTISADGRCVAFWSFATNLVPGHASSFVDVYLRDRQTGTTECVSLAINGAVGNDNSASPSLSSDGRFVAFASDASNLVIGDNNQRTDVFVRDRMSGTIELVSLGSGGAQGTGYSFDPSISSDGRYVAFDSDAPNLVAGDTNQTRDSFVHDRQSNLTERVSVDSNGVEGNSESGPCAISANGRFVVFRSASSNLVPGDTNGVADVFVHDRLSGATEFVSLSSSGVLENDNCQFAVSISRDGRYVVFNSPATNLVAGDTNMRMDVFLRDRQAGTTERVSIDPNGGQEPEESGTGRCAVSDDGRFVTFSYGNIFLRDRQMSTTELLSVGLAGAPANGASGGSPITPDGRFVVYQSDASNLAAGDTNGRTDIFVSERAGGPTFASLCDPGSSGVIACPCANPPSGPGRGCDNSAATGGARLSAAGGSYLSSDSLVFTTSEERPTTFGILLQGTVLVPNGLIYGQGVRCVAGSMKRLFTKNAVNGGITAPEFGAGDPTISAVSAAKGDVIQAGESRWYLVYYRDPIVLGGCPAGSTFNATQTGQVTWSP